MKSLAGLLSIGLGIALLTACNKQEPTNPQEEKGSGSALIHLPELPAGYLAKKTKAIHTALFRLRITSAATGVVTTKNWELGVPQSQEAVVVNGIPAGNSVFYGQLLLDGKVTHEGLDSAYIAGNKTTDVYLYLRDIRDGNARICVVVEGMPMPLYCGSQDSSFYPDLNGCWRATVTSYADTTDNAMSGRLEILQSDSSLQAELIWPNGLHDTSVGIVSRSGNVYFNADGGAAVWSFYGAVDSSGQYLSGDYKSIRAPYSGRLNATRTCNDTIPIDTLPVDTIPVDTLLPVDTTRVDTVVCPNGQVIYQIPGKYVSCPMDKDSAFTGCWLAYVISGNDTTNINMQIGSVGSATIVYAHYWDGYNDSAHAKISGNHISTGWLNSHQEFILDAVSDGIYSTLKGKFSDSAHKVSGIFVAWRRVCKDHVAY